jgi:AAA15 family ATPase/GTPase
MRIKQIEIENYRSIRHLKCDVPQICALVGPNNAGKSNILRYNRKLCAGGVEKGGVLWDNVWFT